jgi:glycerol-3-phosphate dehydrogenase
MLTIRDFEAIGRARYDLIIVGGGIYGAMLALEAVQYGLRPLLVERHDFGAGTSFNSLRIVHGGLRYLQDLDLKQFRQAVSERRWFLRTFPDLVQPLPCLAPLYGDGLQRPAIYRLALSLNDVLSSRRNVGQASPQCIPPGRIIDAAAVKKIFPYATQTALRGGALWHDALIANTPRLIIDVLRWACIGGATVLNYVDARTLIVADGHVQGIEAIDQESGQVQRFYAPTVINAAGPWSRRLAAQFDPATAPFYEPSLAWNILFRRPALSDHAIAVRPRHRGSRMYFLVPWKGQLFAGSGHASWNDKAGDARLSAGRLTAFIADLNDAVPNLRLSRDDVARATVGLLPAARAGSNELLRRGTVIDHAAHGGPKGLISVCGVKFTLARQVAEAVIQRVFPTATHRKNGHVQRPGSQGRHPDYAYCWLPAPGDNTWKEPLHQAIATESVRHLDDLLLRRSAIGDNSARAKQLAPQVCALFDWDTARAASEIEALHRAIARVDNDIPSTSSTLQNSPEH